jgi:hypothetical protein
VVAGRVIFTEPEAAGGIMSNVKLALTSSEEYVSLTDPVNDTLVKSTGLFASSVIVIANLKDSPCPTVS